jgi:hypothetical protein
MIRTQVFSFPVFGRKKRRRRPIYHSSRDDDIWDVDPDDKRRVNENKNWRRHHPEEEAWDIDKERDAVMYKREALEACLRTEYIEKERKEDEEDEQGLEK